MSRRLILAALVVLFPVVAFAQTLADRVPADAMVYVGWRGSDSMGTAYDASHLKAVLAESNVPQIFSEFIPRLIERVNKEEPQAAEVMKIVTAIGAPMWRHPSALYVGAPEAGGNPIPRLILLCQAGADAASLQAQMQSAMEKNPDAALMVQIKTVGDLVVASTTEYSDKPAEALSASKLFKDAMANVAKDPAATIYVDVQRVVAAVDQGAAAAASNPHADVWWPRVCDALGLAGVKSFVWTGSFDGKDWLSRSFIAAPVAERSGFAAMIGGKPISDDILKTIPQNATIAGAGRCDLAKVYDGLLAATAKVDPNTRQQVDQGLQFVNQMLNMNVRDDLLAPLGDAWTYYTDPNVGGNGMLGITVINKLHDPAKAEQGLTKFETSVNTLLRQQLRKEKITIQFVQTKVGDLKIHYLALPAITPAWTIRNGNLYLALYPQILAAAVYATDNGKSILDNKSFVAVRDRLGTKSASSIQFLDLPKTAADGYQMWLFMSRLYLGIGDLFGVQSPAMVIPPLDRLMPHLTPAGGASWTDDAGWHMTAISPFPGSAAIAGGGSFGAASVGESSLLVSILLPSLNRARETANRVRCSSNMRQITLAAIMYANDHHGSLPPDLGTLTSGSYLQSLAVFVCPSSNNALSANLKSMKPEQIAAWVNANTNYVYVGAGKKVSEPAESILLYEKEGDHDGDGINIAFTDAHVEWFTMPAAKKLIEEQVKPALPKNGGL